MKYCNRPFENIYVMPNGRVRVCGWADGAIGNLIDQDVDEIWHGERAERIRESVRNGSFEFCRQMSCPFCENNSLQDVDEKELAELCVAAERPININAAIDYTCNHSCPTCRDSVYVGNEEYRKNVDLMAEKLIPYINKAKRLSTDGQGDAFASPAVMKMLERIRPEDKDTHITIETNGALFNEKNWEKIKHLGDYHLTVIVTPNSFDKDAFTYLNGGHDTYDQVMHNLSFLRGLREKNLINSYKVSIVVQDRNFRELPSFVKRCLEEFHVDVVVVKPVYHWFGLSEDDYWFKDILNPLHPYYKEYLKILENPILKDSRVYFWGGSNIHPKALHPAYKYRNYLNFVISCIENPETKEKIRKFFDEQGIGSLYIYGDEQMSGYAYSVVKDLVTFKGFMARDYKRTEICGLDIIPFEKYCPEKDDSFLVMNSAHVDRIVSDLRVRGCTGKIIGFDTFMEMINE